MSRGSKSAKLALSKPSWEESVAGEGSGTTAVVGGNLTFKTRRGPDLDWLSLVTRVRGGKKFAKISYLWRTRGLELESAHHPTRGGHLHGSPGPCEHGGTLAGWAWRRRSRSAADRHRT